jgi:hypothetical protein
MFSGRHTDVIPMQSSTGLLQAMLGRKHLHDEVDIHPIGHAGTPMSKPPSAVQPGHSGVLAMLTIPDELPLPPESCPTSKLEGPEEEEQAATRATPRASAKACPVKAGRRTSST